MYGRGARSIAFDASHVVGDDLVRVVERRLALPQQLGRLLVVVLGVAAVDVGGLRRPSASRGRAAAAGSRRARSADRAARRPPGSARSRTTGRAARRWPPRPSGSSRPGRGSPRPRARARVRRRSTRRGRSRHRSSTVGSRRIGVPGRPRSPEKTMIRSSPPSRSETRSRMIADPRMWPASTNVAWTPGATSTSSSVAERPELGERPRRPPRPCRAAHRGRSRGAAAGRGGRPPGRAARRSRPVAGGAGSMVVGTCSPGRGRVGRDSGVGSLGGDRDGDVRQRDGHRDPCGATPSGQLHRGLVRLRLLPVVGLDLVRMAPLPARFALRELLVEAARIEEHERRELDRCRRWRGSGPRNPSFDEQRQQPAVVEVRVGQEHGVERRLDRSRTGSGCGSTRSGCPGTCRSRPGRGPVR